MRRGAYRWLSRYLYEAPLTLLFVTVLSFVLMRLSPISPAEAYARRNTPYPTAENIERVTREMGLDQPLIMQYVKWLVNALQLNFGQSLMNGNDAWAEFVQMVPATLQIVGMSVAIQITGVLVAGMLMYLFWETYRGWLFRTGAVLCLSVPVFYFASLYLELFAVRLEWITVAGGMRAGSYIHPAICLAIPVVAFYGRMLGSLLRKEMSEDYADYARCRGLSEARIVWRHAMPRAAIGITPSFLQNIGFTVAGAAIVERVFSIPGMGSGIIDSVLHRDSPMIHLFVLFLGAVFVLMNGLSDLSARVLGPRRVVKEAS